MGAWVIGIDPGLGGALALLDDQGRPVHVSRPPTITSPSSSGKTNRRQYNLPLLRKILDSMRDMASEQGSQVVVYMEAVHAMPTDGGIQAFAFGRSFGQLEGLLAALQMPYTSVHSSEWKAYMVSKNVRVAKTSKEESGKITKKMRNRMRYQVTKARKIASIEAATRLFPEQAELFVGQDGDGAAEALLLALWGIRRETSTGMTKPKQETVVVAIPEHIPDDLPVGE